MLANTYLADYVRSFFEDHLACRRNMSANTIRSYRDGVKLLLQFAVSSLKKPATELRVADFTESLVLKFLADLERARRNSIQTRNHRLAIVRCLFGYIAAREPLLLDVCRRIMTVPMKRGAAVPPMRYLTKDEIAALLATPDRSTSTGQRDHALLLFMYNTGARVQEAADATISWLSLEAPYKVDILGKGRKWRVCPIWKSTAQTLRRLVQIRSAPPKQDDYLFLNRFGHPLSRHGIADIIRRRASAAATAKPSAHRGHVTPHMIRHTTAMHLLQSGVEMNVIRSWLGHVSIATTDRYVEIDLEMKAKALKTCEVDSRHVRTKRWRTDPGILSWLESL